MTHTYNAACALNSLVLSMQDTWFNIAKELLAIGDADAEVVVLATLVGAFSGTSKLDVILNSS